MTSVKKEGWHWSTARGTTNLLLGMRRKHGLMQELSAWAHGLRQLRWGGAESSGGWAGVSVLPGEAETASASPFVCFKSLCSHFLWTAPRGEAVALA